MGRLEGKVAIITGALGGIGRADAALFAREGARLVLTDVSERGAGEFAASLGADALFLTHDVASEEDWIRVVATTEERFGRLDVLVNNAGLILLGNVAEASYADWRRVHAVNLDGVFLGCKHALPAIEHGFTHFRLTLHPQRVAVRRWPTRAEAPGYAWLLPADALAAALPAPIRKLLRSIAVPARPPRQSRARAR